MTDYADLFTDGKQEMDHRSVVLNNLHYFRMCKCSWFQNAITLED